MIKQNHREEQVAIVLPSADGILKKRQFISKKNIYFYKMLREILPTNLVVLPKVVLGTVLQYNGNNLTKKNFLHKYIDFVIFDISDFEPLLAFDLTDFDSVVENMNLMRKDIIQVLNSNNIPCLCLPAKNSYDKKMIQNMIFSSLSNEKLKKIGVDYVRK